MLPSPIRLSLVVLIALASGLVACTPPPPIEHPVALSFRPTKVGEALWLATPFAIELRSEQDARILEAFDPIYVGEIGVASHHIPAGQQALIPLLAAEQGATHYRFVCAGESMRIDVVLYRVERDRWHWLPEALRPASPAGPSISGQSQASL